MSMMQWQNCD